jgi:multiple sugar transport system permease protein
VGVAQALEETRSPRATARLSRATRQYGWPIGLVTPVVAILVLLMYVPILDAARLSLTNSSLLRPGYRFVGLDNYIKALTSSEFWSIAGQTALWAATTVGGAAILGVGGAVLLTGNRHGRPLRGRALLSGLLLVPFVAPPVVSAYIWNYLYAGAGPINGLLTIFGLRDPIYFLSDLVSRPLGVALPMWSLVQVGIWSGFPFFFLMAAAALTSVPIELHEAAAIDGATGWRAFRSITLPLIAPVIEITIFLELLFRLGGLDLPILLTGGGPLNASNVWGVFIYQVAFARFDVGYGAGLGIVLFLIGAPFSIWYVRRARRQLAGL